MASAETISKVLKEIIASYPGKFTSSADTIKAWAVYLVDIDDELLMAAVRSFISSSEHGFPPSIPELRKEATKLRRDIMGVPDVWAAWEDLIKAGRGIKHIVTDETDEEERSIVDVIHYQFLHPLVEQVGRGLGWPEKFPVPGNEMSDRAAFRDAYNEALTKLTKNDMQLESVRLFVQREQKLLSDNPMKQLAEGMRK